MMKINNRAKTLIFSLIAVSVLGLIFLPTQQPQKAAQTTTQSSRPDYINRVSQGLAEAGLATRGLDSALKVDSMANLMQIRSGININPVARQQLTLMETAAIDGKQPLVSFDRVVDIVTDTVLEQASKLTDEDINLVITTARGFSAPGIPDKLKNQDIGIFPGYYIQVSDKEAVKQLKAATNVSAQLFIKPRIASKIKEQARTYLADFAKASPSAFGQNWDGKNNKPAKGLTPSQAILLTYSLVSGDSFADTISSLASTMQKKQDALVKRHGSYPSPSGHTPYGANGYLFSSAFALFFNEQNQLTLLNKFSGKE
ncbi:MAG: hypothetical protein FD167_585 [bacterium]|nr:MAG: hypothetical protein FD167_585 [bacterium]